MINLQDIQKLIPEAVEKKDVFGGQYFFIPSIVLSKRKAWNLCLKRGFLPCENKQYLQKDGIYVYNNSLHSYLNIGV